MNPARSTDDISKRIREAENRHKSINADYCVFMRRVQSMKRGIFLLQFNILEYRKKMMATQLTKSHTGVVCVSSPGLTVENCDETFKSVLQSSAVRKLQMDSHNCSCYSKQRKEHGNPDCLKHEGSEVCALLLEKQECTARNTTKGDEGITTAEMQNGLEYDWIHGESSNSLKGVKILQVVQGKEDDYRNQKDVLNFTKFSETRPNIPRSPDSSFKWKIITKNGSPLISCGSTTNIDKKIHGQFLLFKANESLKYDSPYKYSLSTLENVRASEKDSYGNVESSQLPDSSGDGYNNQKSMINLINPSSECGDKSSAIEFHKLLECSAKDHVTMLNEIVSPPENINAENWEGSLRPIRPVGKCPELKASSSNRTVPLIPQIAIQNVSNTESHENLSNNLINISTPENFQKLDYCFDETTLRYHNKEDPNDNREKTHASEANINGLERNPPISTSVELRALKPKVGEYDHPQHFARIEKILKIFERRDGACVVKVSQEENVSSRSRKAFASMNRGREFLNGSKSETQISLLSPAHTCDSQKYSSLEALKSIVTIKEAKSFTTFMSVKRNEPNCSINPSDHYYSGDDRQVLLQSSEILEKRKRKCFHFSWKSFRNVKKRTKTLRHNHDIFSSKSKEDINRREKKPGLFLRLFGTLMNCGYISENRARPNDLPEVFDPLEE